jgi:ABC-type phosphate transport system permease subunit
LKRPVRRRIRNPYIGRVAIMIRFLLRFLGLLSLALGFIFLVYDGAKSIVDQRLYISSVREAWNSVSEGSLAQLQSALQRMMPGLWDPVAVTILDTPVALLLAILGALLLLLGRKKKPLIGYARS